MTFPYCLKVFLNLWTRLIDLSCNGSGSEESVSTGLCLGTSAAEVKGFLSSDTLGGESAGCDDKALFFEVNSATPAWRHRLGGSSAKITLHPTLDDTDCPFMHWKTLLRGKTKHIPCASWDAVCNTLLCILMKCGQLFCREETTGKEYWNAICYLICNSSNATWNSEICFLFYFKRLYLPLQKFCYLLELSKSF